MLRLWLSPVLFTLTTALSAQTPATLTYQDLVARPELAPSACKPTAALQFGNQTVSPETSYPILELRDNHVVILLPDMGAGPLPPGSCDVLAVANANYQAMTPAQRALDSKTLAARADLWPDRVKLQVPFQSKVGDQKQNWVLGHEFVLGSFDGTDLKVRCQLTDLAPSVAAVWTDLFDQARKNLIGKPPHAGHRVLQELDGKLVSMRTGKKAKLDAMRSPEFVLLYFSAGWCDPCRQFSPKLVSFYEKNKKLAGKRFEVIWISRDKGPKEMEDYARDCKFPWLAVAWKMRRQIPVTQAYATGGIPDLVILDASGAVLADSYVHGEYEGPYKVLDKLAELLKQKR